jgi:hypothetical protein
MLDGTARYYGGLSRAYRRSELFDKRRKLMAGWGTFCMTPAEGEDRSNRRGTTG